jgi:hypothetical protein
MEEKSKPMEQGNEKQSGRIICQETLELIYMSPSGPGKRPSYPKHLSCDTNPSGAYGSWSTPLHRTATPSVVCVLPTQALWSHHVSTDIEASRCAQIPSPPAKPPVLVLWLNQVTRRFCGEPPQTLCADSGHEPVPYTGNYA